MRKTLAIILMIVLLTGTAQADITIVHNKADIDTALRDYAKAYTQRTGVGVNVIASSDSYDYSAILKAEFDSGSEPDIFVIEDTTDYEHYRDRITPMNGAEWVSYTEAAYMDGDNVIGFPTSLEGYGMAYNADILARTGIDPATLTNFDAYASAFEKIDSMKEQLGLDAVISMTASTAAGMAWVTGRHNFNIYLAVGLDRNDTSIIDRVLAGEVDEERFHQYCLYVDLIFQYSDRELLLNGTHDSQLAAFMNQKTAFYHQGNWMDPYIMEQNPQFDMALAPHAFLKEDTDGIPVNPPSWYVVNGHAGHYDEAVAFLNSIVCTAEGHDYMVNKAGIVPAFTNIEIEPVSPLSKSVMRWNVAGKTYGWQQYKLPEGFASHTLGAIYELFAAGTSDLLIFETMMKNAIATIPTL